MPLEFHRPKRSVVFGMTIRGIPVQILPKLSEMTPEQTGVYVHADEYDKVFKLLNRIETICINSSLQPCADKVLMELTNFKKELGQHV